MSGCSGFLMKPTIWRYHDNDMVGWTTIWVPMFYDVAYHLKIACEWHGRLEHVYHNCICYFSSENSQHLKSNYNLQLWDGKIVLVNADLALSQSQLNEGTEGSMAAWDIGSAADKINKWGAEGKLQTNAEPASSHWKQRKCKGKSLN